MYVRMHAQAFVQFYLVNQSITQLKWYFYGANPNTFSAPHIMQFCNMIIIQTYVHIFLNGMVHFPSRLYTGSVLCIQNVQLNYVLLFSSSQFMFMVPAVVHYYYYYYYYDDDDSSSNYNFHYHTIVISYIFYKL